VLYGECPLSQARGLAVPWWLTAMSSNSGKETMFVS